MFFVVQTQGGREYMEDTFIAEENFYTDMDIYAVFDGHAGSYVSNFLRDNVKPVLIKYLQEGKYPIDDCLYLTCRTMTEMMSKEESKNTGSTCLIALRKKQQPNDIWYFANAGDCRAIVGSDKGAVRLTNDHKPHIPKEFSRITSIEGGFVTHNPHDVPRVNGMLAVSRSLGDTYLHPYVRWEPEVSTLKPNHDNRLFIIASDGIWDTMEDNDVLTVFNKKIKEANGLATKQMLYEASVECIQLAQAKGSGDNMTIISAIF